MPLLENLFSHGAVERLGWMLVHFLWQAVAVALLLAALLRLLGRASANLRYLVACGALALMVATPLVTMQFIDVPGPVAEAGPLPEILTPVFVTMETIEELPPLPSTPPVEITDLAVPIPWHERLATALEPGLPYVVLGWFAGVLGLSAWHLGGWTQLQRLKRRMVRETGDALHATLDGLATRLGVRRVVTLLESAFVEVPTVVGWLRPTILLPASALTGLSPDQLRAILAHELAHIRRYDYLANIVQTVVEILGFYHPAVWWVSHQIRIERENCCDDLAVRVCDNSLQYARALASMEEIRHSRSELAMAASGGSLMARIARLLGRPVVDDRRFTWLPGLIALLLVLSVVIPAALVMAAPATEPASQVAKVVTLTEQSSPPIDEPPRAQVLLTFTVLDIVADRTLDADTAAQARPCLARTQLTDGGTASTSAPPLLEELLLPLRDVFARFTPIPEKSKEFTDLLVSRGYATVLSKPMLLTPADEPASLSLGEPDDPNAANGYIRLNVTAHVLDDRDATRLEIDYADRSAIGNSNDPNRPVSSTRIASTLMVPNDEYIAVVGRNAGTPGANMRMLLIGPTKVNRPQPAAGQDPNTNAQSRTDKPGSTLADGYASHAEHLPRQVFLDTRVVEIECHDLLNLGVAWGSPPLQAGPTPNDSGLFKSIQIGLSPDQTTADSLMTRLHQLHAANRVRVMAAPQFVSEDGHPVELLSFPEEWVTYANEQAAQEASRGRDECKKLFAGASLLVTPLVDDDNEITLEVTVETSKSHPQNGGASDLPIVTRRRAKNKVTIQDGGTIALAGLVENPGGQRGPSAKPVVIFTTVFIVSENGALSKLYPTVSQKTQTPTRPEITAPATIADAITKRIRISDAPPPRHVLLDARVVEIKNSNLAKLGMKFDHPVSHDRQVPKNADWTKAISIGYAPDQMSTDILLERLNQLEATHQAKIVGNPRLDVQDGHPFEVQSVPDEWFAMTLTVDPNYFATSAEIVPGTTLTVTPHMGDSDKITLDLEVGITVDLRPGHDANGTPIWGRGQVKSRVTMQDGGTTVVAGLVRGSGMSNGKLTKKVAIFVTAHVIPR
jgi:type II secretory pathway component GspD/PulD (secretin)/beta-lactamase regulating signal transducer with metallopeptidase domain